MGWIKDIINAVNGPKLVASYQITIDNTEFALSTIVNLPSNLKAIKITPEAGYRSVSIRFEHDATASGSSPEWDPYGDFVFITNTVANAIHLYTSSTIKATLNVYT